MIPNPIQKVLSTLPTHRVRYLLMGGQACVLYGAAEFSRDCDIAILCEPQSLSRLQSALEALQVQREADRSYWEPLKRELENLRHDRLQ